jgi:hypothetical protein
MFAGGSPTSIRGWKRPGGKLQSLPPYLLHPLLSLGGVERKRAEEGTSLPKAGVARFQPMGQFTTNYDLGLRRPDPNYERSRWHCRGTGRVLCVRAASADAALRMGRYEVVGVVTKREIACPISSAPWSTASKAYCLCRRPPAVAFCADPAASVAAWRSTRQRGVVVAAGWGRGTPGRRYRRIGVYTLQRD